MHAQNQVHQPRQPGYDENIIGEQLCSRPAAQRPLHSRRLRELDDDIHSIRPATTQSHFDLDLHDEEGMGIFDVYQYQPPYPGNRGNDGYVTSNKQIDPSLLQLHRQPHQQPDPVLGQQRPGTVAIRQPVHQYRRIGDKGYAIGQELLGRTAPNQFHQPGQQQSVEAEYDANGAAKLVARFAIIASLVMEDIRMAREYSVVLLLASPARLVSKSRLGLGADHCRHKSSRPGPPVSVPWQSREHDW